jgi:hypothetical protein
MKPAFGSYSGLPVPRAVFGSAHEPPAGSHESAHYPALGTVRCAKRTPKAQKNASVAFGRSTGFSLAPHLISHGVCQALMLMRKISFFWKIILPLRSTPGSLLPWRKTVPRICRKRFLDVPAAWLYYAPIDLALATACTEQSQTSGEPPHVKESALRVRPPCSSFY